MPSPELIAAFDAANERHTAAVDDFVPLLIEMALASIAEVLPGASVLETEGEMNEDWVFTLRIQRVLDSGEEVLYDIDSGHDDTEVETTIDEVGVDYLDLLLDLTGEEYLGRQTIRRRSDTLS
jgi:hypothetical protein